MRAGTTVDCGKVGYESPQRAERYLRRALRVMPEREGRGMNVYRCSNCRLWHCGHGGERTRRRLPDVGRIEVEE